MCAPARLDVRACRSVSLSAWPASRRQTARAGCEPERRASRPVSFGRREPESWARDAEGQRSFTTTRPRHNPRNLKLLYVTLPCRGDIRCTLPQTGHARQVLTLTLSSRCPRRPRHSSMVNTFSTVQACREFQPLLGLRRVGAKLVLCRHTSHGVTFGVRCGAVHANPKLHICPRHAWECDPARRDVLGSTRVGVGGKVIQAFKH